MYRKLTCMRPSILMLLGGEVGHPSIWSDPNLIGVGFSPLYQLHAIDFHIGINQEWFNVGCEL